MIINITDEKLKEKVYDLTTFLKIQIKYKNIQKVFDNYSLSMIFEIIITACFFINVYCLKKLVKQKIRNSPENKISQKEFLHINEIK